MKPIQAAILGNPNSGKSTLFNGLTGSHQHTGNWPGVTVEQACGLFNYKADIDVELIDLPGCYSLVATSDMSLDESLTSKYLSDLDANLDIIVNVVDASNLARDLYLTLQLLEMGRPMVVALNCYDLAKKQGKVIDIKALAQELGCAVVPVVAKTGAGLAELKDALVFNARENLSKASLEYLLPQPLLEVIDKVKGNLPKLLGLRALEGDLFLCNANLFSDITVDGARDQLAGELEQDVDISIAKVRRHKIHEILNQTVRQGQAASQFDLDKILLHPVWGLPIFLLIMYSMFGFCTEIGGMLQSGVEHVSEHYLIGGASKLLQAISAPNWLQTILVAGVLQGLQITLTFVPVLTLMFICLSILENSGYMARAAFLVDKIMQLFGLPGKSFVPMIIGFGCNVPAVMGARTLNNYRERVLAILMTPFMSCSARLAIYAIFVAAFFPKGGQNVIFSLYLVGILVAMLTGIALSSSALLGSEASISLAELPSYRVPAFKHVLRTACKRSLNFVHKAVLLIIPLCLLFNCVGERYVEQFGRKLTPIFAPMGINEANWQASVGLVSGLIAKEALIGTLNALYSNEMQTTTMSTMTSSSSANMVASFGNVHAAYAYLLFTLLYFPCISVVAAMAKELNKKWALFSVIWSTVLAYSVATGYYQLATQQWRLPVLGACSAVLIAMLLVVRVVTWRNAGFKRRQLPTLISVST